MIGGILRRLFNNSIEARGRDSPGIREVPTERARYRIVDDTGAYESCKEVIDLSPEVYRYSYTYYDGVIVHVYRWSPE